MPIHLNDLNVASEVAGSRSALIVPCNMCPGATLAARKKRPFIQFFKSLLKSASLEQHIQGMQSQLEEQGVHTSVFRSDLPHQWFVCMWTAGRRKKLRNQAKRHDAVIVLGCDSATETAREAVDSDRCKVIPGMEVAGIMNAKLTFRFPGNISFEDCTIVAISRQGTEEGLSH